MPRFLDTNILLRYLTGDDEQKARASYDLLLRVERGEEEVVTSDLVISEVVFTLQSPRGYRLSRDLIRDNLNEAGVEQTFVTLHVGLDTFRPVQGEDPREHQIHTEYFEIGRGAVDALNRARQDGRRIIAVGTTSVRVLEHLALLIEQSAEASLRPTSGNAGIYILPGHRFRLVNALITNFHLPRSTLLMLVSAFAGREEVLDAYQEAIKEQYRFYSFGDAMLIL